MLWRLTLKNIGRSVIALNRKSPQNQFIWEYASWLTAIKWHFWARKSCWKSRLRRMTANNKCFLWLLKVNIILGWWLNVGLFDGWPHWDPQTKYILDTASPRQLMIIEHECEIILPTTRYCVKRWDFKGWSDCRISGPFRRAQISCSFSPAVDQ